MTDLDLMNDLMRDARARLERELRAGIEEASILLAEYHGVVAPTDAVTAAADPAPSHLSPPERVAWNISRIVRRGQEQVSLAAARGLATRRAQDWYARHEARLTQQADRAGVEASRVISGMVQSHQITAIEKDGRAAYSLARSVESVGAGGPPSVSATGDVTGAKPITLMDDTEFRAMILDEGSAEPVYTWEHGMPPEPFTPHLELDGTTWTVDDELETLRNPNDFPRTLSYFPGDHTGCTCRYDVEFARTT